MQRAIDALARLVTQRPNAVLFAALLISIPAAWYASGLRASTARTALVADDDPHWQRYMAFAAEFGIPEDLVVVAKGESAEQVRAFTDDLAARLAQSGATGSIFHRVDLRAFDLRAPLFLPLDQWGSLEKVAAHPAFGRLRGATENGASVDALAETLALLPTLVDPEQAKNLSFAPAIAGLFDELHARALSGKTGALAWDEATLRARALGARAEAAGMDVQGYLSTNEGRTGLVLVRPPYTRDEIEVVLPFVAAVRSAAEAAQKAHPGVWFGLAGLPASQVDELTTITRDSASTSILSVLGVVLLFLYYFPALRLLVMSLVPITFGTIWTAAAIRWAFGYVNLMSSIFLVVLISMGIDFAIHLSSRFLEERQAGLTVVQAAAKALSRAGPGIITGATTSAGAFAAVGFSGFRGVEELGWAAAMGLLFTLAAALTLFPALLARFGEGVPNRAPRRLGASGLAFVALRWPRAVLATAFVVTVPLAWFATHTPFDFSLINILPKNAESAVLMTELMDHKELSANAVAITAPDLATARDLEAKLRVLPDVHHVVSAASFLPEGQPAKLAQMRRLLAVLGPSTSTTADLDAALNRLEQTVELLAEAAFQGGDKSTVEALERALEQVAAIRSAWAADKSSVEAGLTSFFEVLRKTLQEAITRLQTAVQAGELTAQDLPADLVSRFISPRGRYAVYVAPQINIWDRPALGQFLAELRTVTPDITGFPQTFYENAEKIRSGFLKAAWYAALAVALLAFLDLKRVSSVLFALLPVTLGAVWMLGAMRLFGISYNLANIVGLPVIIGVGIDAGIHLIHRYRESASVEVAVVHTGAAVMLSALTTMVGFGSLAFASHRGYRSLGLILFIGVGACLVAAVTVLPATLATFGRPRSR